MQNLQTGPFAALPQGRSGIEKNPERPPSRLEREDPERFEDPAGLHISRVHHAAGFELLKQRILLRLLDEEPSSEIHCVIMREVLTAAALARGADFPLLLFPCLFEERVSNALREEEEKLAAYWLTLRGPEEALSA